MKGQLEISFQWIFVLLAGGTFLIIFLFAMRSCTQSGDARLQTLSATRAASAISTAAWYPQVNMTLQLPAVEVSCISDTLTLSTSGSNPARGTLDKVPAFLGPKLEGGVHVVTRDILAPTNPSLRVGSVLYAIDDKVSYFLVENPAHDERKITGVLGTLPSVKTVTPGTINAELAKISSTDAAIVIASFAAPTPVTYTGPVPVYWVQINNVTRKVTFHERKASGIYTNAGSDNLGVEDYFGDHLMAGAVVAGRRAAYRCARANFITRTRYLLTILADRADSLSTALRTQDRYCSDKLAEAKIALVTINNPATDPLPQLLTRGALSAKQQALYENACPVIG